jgi:hypothetical protein
MASTPLLGSCQQRSGEAGSQLEFGQRLLDELICSGALTRDGDVVFDV